MTAEKKLHEEQIITICACRAKHRLYVVLFNE